MKSCKSFLRWAGSKRQLLHNLTTLIKIDFNSYFEPFMGSSQLFFKLSPSSAILSDINKNLVDTYLTVRDHPDELFEKLNQLDSDKNTYYNLRSIDPLLLSTIDQAVRFIYLNMNCFNGLYRTNLKGQFNVPYSGNKIKAKMKYVDLIECSNNLKNAKILCCDFEKVIIENVVKNDLCYLDPPYAIKNSRIFQQYDPNSFGTDDLMRLSSSISYIDSRQAYFILSYAHCPEIEQIANTWNSQIVYTKRNISGFANSRKIEQEVIITNLN
jgi:DNA adenine methylase